MRAHGFNSGMITDLIGIGLAAAERETLAGAMPADVIRIKITEAGQEALKRRQLGRLGG